MSACDVENGLPPMKRIKTDELNENSGLKRMQVGEEDLGKLLELKDVEPPSVTASVPIPAPTPAPTAEVDPKPTPVVNGETSPVRPQVIECPEPSLKQELVEPVVKVAEETSEIPEPTPSTPPVEETSQPRPLTPKEELVTPPPPSVTLPMPSEEPTRKRSVEKEQEGEGSSGSDSDSSRKKNRTEQETETPSTNLPNGNSLPPAEDERERMISDFIAEVSISTDSITEAAERLAKEVENLAELAAAKELEWNTILRIKKLKEEMLERVLRRKRINHFDGQFNSELPVPDLSNNNNNNKGIPGSLQFPLRHPRLTEMNKLPQRPILPKPVNNQYSPVTIGREGRNGPIVDVKSIIDDYSGVYRSRHPESPARRGRRVRGVLTSEQRFPSVNPSLISMANMALGTGASVRTVSDHMPFMGIGGVDHTRGEMGPNKESLGGGGVGGRGSVVGGNGAKPYPEVTLHPVSPPSLLHQVLTKSVPPRPANFSPTLARLLTAPERPSPPPHFRPPPRVSIADILSSTKLKNLTLSEAATIAKYPTIVMNLMKEGDNDMNGESLAESNEESNGPSEQLNDVSERLAAPLEVSSSQKESSSQPTSTSSQRDRHKRVSLSSSKASQKVELSQIEGGSKLKVLLPTTLKKSVPVDNQENGESGVVPRSSERGLVKARAKSLKKRPPTPSPSRRPSSQSDSSRDSTDQDITPQPKKSRNEITITPVSGNPGTKNKEDVVCLDDDDGDSGALVIDEGGDEVPTCQGCRHKSAQFVCAGCGNQWYCSRECQVSAWEEHSDMCSG